MNFPGYGGKRPLLYVHFERLHLDLENPRLPSFTQNQNSEAVKNVLLKSFNLEELAYSMAANGYFDEEPLVAIPNNLPEEFTHLDYESLKDNKEYENFINASTTTFTVVEGNRRLATVKLLLSNEVKSFPPLEPQIRDDLLNLPAIIYPHRREVISYLGVRHIVGIKKWDSYAKARYVASMKERHGLSLDDIQRQVGDTSNSAKKIYTSYRLIEVVEQEFELDTTKAKENFSFLMLAIGQGSIKDFIGLPKTLKDINFDTPVPPNKLDNLKLLFSFIFGEGKDRLQVIKESRDITNKLTPILRSDEATSYLRTYRDIDAAYDRSDGEESLLIKYLREAKRRLEQSMPLVDKYQNDDVRDLLNDIKRTLESIEKIMQ